MNTVNTKIKDFAVGDLFAMYGAIFTVTDEVKVWYKHNGSNDNTPTFGRHCEFVEHLYGSPKGSDTILEMYDWMQGIEEVTYAKVIDLENLRHIYKK